MNGMKKVLSLALALAMTLSLAACGGGNGDDTQNNDNNNTGDNNTGNGDTIELTMGSWRTDDVEQMNALLAEYKNVAPNVNITFQPTNPSDYNATLRMQLEGGTGPDLMYARSYATGIELFDSGYFADCTGFAGMENFTDTAKAPWQTPDGKMFAVPFAAVSHGVYYNKTIFEQENLTVPTTWDEFITLCQTLKDKGYTPLANGLADEWDILECFFLSMVPSFVGTADERVKYETGEKKMDDPAFVNTYAAIAQAAPYLPTGFEAITYNDSQVLFSTQQAVMFVDGSWTAGVYQDADFDWGVFAVPGPTAESTAITFHPDMAITMNTATTHPAEAQAFLEWLATEEGATTASKNLPVGYFPMINFDIQLEDAHANEFLALNNGRQTDARFVWPALMDLYAPMNQAVIQVIKGEVTPEQAAASVAAAMSAPANVNPEDTAG